MQITYASSSGFVARTIVLTLATMLAALLLPGIEVNGLWAAIGTAIVIAVLDNIVRPILIVVTLPVTVLSLGLFLFIINAIIIEMADGLLGRSFEVDNFGWALLFSILLTLFNYLLELPNRRRQTYQNNEDPSLPQQDDDHFDDYEEVE